MVLYCHRRTGGASTLRGLKKRRQVLFLKSRGDDKINGAGTEY